MKTNALIIFTRNPVLGRVKTRLAKTIGKKKALEVYRDLLFHTMTETQSIDCDKYLFYDEAIDPNDIWSNDIYKKRVQFGFELGDKMQNAFELLFKQGYRKCIIIGSDSFELKRKHIIEALEKLEHNDVVIGPAEDGGYYLLGLKKVIPSIFKNKDWGNSSVLSDTLKNLENATIDFLEILNDIDTIEDLEKSKHYQLNSNI
jgi:rSAM/selenodomain-associated transferase 1